MKKSKRRRLRLLGLLVFILAISSASVLLVWPRHIEERHRGLEERLQSEVHSFSRRRWERPPLEGEPLAGNAAEASILASRGLSDLPLVGTPELAAALRAGEVPSDLIAILEAQADRIERLRESAARAFSRRAGSFDYTAEPTRHDRVAGIHLVLGDALREDPAACAERVAAAIRIAQDASAGGGLEASADAADEIDLALEVLPRCFESASDESLRELEAHIEKASELFRTLAENPVPLGDALEHAALAQARDLARATAPSDSPMDALKIRHTLARPAQLNTLAHTLDVAEDFLRVDTQDYPERLTDAAALVGSLPLGLEADLGRRIDALFVIRRHGEVAARMNAAAIALQDLASPSPGAPAWLMASALADPFSGGPLAYRFEAGSLVLWSVGHDGVDQHASLEVRAGGAPADVVFVLRSRRQTRGATSDSSAPSSVDRDPHEADEGAQSGGLTPGTARSKHAESSPPSALRAASARPPWSARGLESDDDERERPR